MKSAILILLALVIISIEVHAISVASDYLVNGTLELIEGTSKIYSIRLQNPNDNEAGVKLDYDATFLKVIDYKEVYILPPKTTGYSVLLNVTAPKKPGMYTIGYTVSEVEPGASGGLPIRLKINKSFKLRVIEEPDNGDNRMQDTNKLQLDYSNLAYIAILLIIILFLFRIFIKKKHTKKNRKVNK